jgi:hypothetical protein
MGAKIQQSVCVQVLQPRRFAGTQPLGAFGVALQLNLGLALVDSQWPSNFLLQHHCTQIKYWNFAAKYLDELHAEVCPSFKCKSSVTEDASRADCHFKMYIHRLPVLCFDCLTHRRLSHLGPVMQFQY